MTTNHTDSPDDIVTDTGLTYAEFCALLEDAYSDVIDYLKAKTGLVFTASHTGGGVYSLVAAAGTGRVYLTDSDGLHEDYDGDADDGWTAMLNDEPEWFVDTNLSAEGALYAVAVACLPVGGLGRRG